MAATANTKTKTITVANGQSLSGEVDLEGYVLAGLVLPSDIDSATSITFQGCNVTGGTFVDLYDDAGNEVTLTVAASRGIGIDAAAVALAAWRFIKVRLGTSASPVTTTAERTLELVLKG